MKKAIISKLLVLVVSVALLLAAVQTPFVVSTAELKNLITNGAFDTDVSGWTLYTSNWGELTWDETNKCANFKKISASSGPEIYNDALKVSSGDRVTLSYDYKTSVALTGTATSVFIYAYTSEFVTNKGTTTFRPTGSDYVYEFVNTTTDWQTNELSYTVPEGYEYVQVKLAFRGAVAANTVFNIDNIELYKIDENYVINEIENAIANDDQTAFDTWISDSALGIENLDESKYEDYFTALKSKNTIDKQTIQTVVNSFIYTAPESIIPNGTFDNDVNGWTVYTTNWGSLSWDETTQSAKFTKISASSGPEIYTDALKVSSGDRVTLSYDYKTSVALTGTATSVYIYTYTSEFVTNKGTTTFRPTGSDYVYEFVNTTTDWQTNELSYTVPDGYEYIQVKLAFRGAVAANTVFDIDNVLLYRIDENYVMNEIRKAIANDDQTAFNTWIGDTALGIKSLNGENYTDYFTVLKQETVITKEVIQAVVDSFVVTNLPTSLLQNGVFDADVTGWKLSNTVWGELTWDSSLKAASFKKLSASSGPTIYSDAVKVESGDRLCLNYDYKTSAALTGTATSVYIYAYTSDFVTSKGTTSFSPTGSVYTSEFVDTTTDWQTKEITYTVPAGYEYVQVVFGFRGAVAAETILNLDNIKLYTVDAEYILYKMSQALEAGDRFALVDWMLENELGLENVKIANRKSYLTELNELTEALTKESVQEIVNAVNTACENSSILENGIFDTSISPWRAYSDATPTATHSSSDGGCVALTKADSVISKMLSEVVDVSYGDILHLEFTAKATVDNVALTLTNSQFTKDELTAYGDNAGSEGNEASSTSTATFNLSTEAKTYIADIKIGADIYGYVAAFSLESGTTGDIVYIDDVVINRGTREFVNERLNHAIDTADKEAFKKWMKHLNSELVYEIIEVDDELMTSLKTAKDKKGENLTADEIAMVSSNMVTDIGTRLELFVDDTLIDTENTTADLVSMTPEFKEQAINLSGGFVCDNIANEVYTGSFDASRITEDTRPWESLGSTFGNVIKAGDKYYYYYRGVDDEVTTVDRYVNGYGNHDPSVAYHLNVCLAVSDDGVNWTRPELNLYDFEYEGENLPNNIIIGNIMENFGGGTNGGRHLCSFSVIKDDGPNGNPQKPYKAMMVLTMQRGWGFDLFAMESADGIKWDVMNNGEPVVSNGRNDIMDSMNVVLWCEETQEYKMYFRMWQEHPEYGQQRAVATISSKDFINWTSIDTESEFLDYYSDKTDEELTERNIGYNGNHPDSYQLYTNGIQTYDRAPHIYIGMPTRYLGNNAHEVAPYLVAGRDGQNFKFWDTKLIEPSAELGRDGNRSNYSVCGIFRTSETEYSFLATRDFKNSGCIIDRFSFRVDGFVSAKGDESGKKIVTTPITFKGNKLVLNYKAPSGTVRAQLTDVDGNVLQGFSYDDCMALTGDSIEQELVFKGDLSTINQPVKISFELINAELYSYRFVCSEHEYTNANDAECVLCAENRDVNDDGEYDIRDLVYVDENIANGSWYKKSADKNGDGVINLKDIAIICKKILKTIIRK